MTASLVHENGQNVSYAVKFQLLSALLTSTDINLNNLDSVSESRPKKSTLASLTRFSTQQAKPQRALAHRLRRLS